MTQHGTSNSPAQSGEKHIQHQISNQASIEVQPGQSSASQSNIQTPVSQQHSLEIPAVKLHQTSEQSTSQIVTQKQVLFVADINYLLSL